MRSVRNIAFVVLMATILLGTERGVGAVGFCSYIGFPVSELGGVSDCWDSGNWEYEVLSAGACEQYHWCNTLEWACMNWCWDNEQRDLWVSFCVNDSESPCDYICICEH